MKEKINVFEKAPEILTNLPKGVLLRPRPATVSIP